MTDSKRLWDGKSVIVVGSIVCYKPYGFESAEVLWIKGEDVLIKNEDLSDDDPICIVKFKDISSPSIGAKDKFIQTALEIYKRKSLDFSHDNLHSKCDFLLVAEACWEQHEASIISELWDDRLLGASEEHAGVSKDIPKIIEVYDNGE